jgi:hypothetical protein
MMFRGTPLQGNNKKGNKEKSLRKCSQFTYTALHAPGTWYFKCNLDNQYLAWVFVLSVSRANSKFSFADWKKIK